MNLNLKSRLPGLNGLRSIAALAVLFIHVYEIAAFNGDHWADAFYSSNSLIGKSMVNLFFVISGFIITYILYREKQKTGKISLKNFYIKRILRIWPLYFGLLILVSVLYNVSNVFYPFQQMGTTAFVLIILFAFTFSGLFGNLGFSVFPHYWSLSVEEQFYIFWPLIFKFIKDKHVVRFCFIVIAGMLIARNGLSFVVTKYHFEGVRNVLIILNSTYFGSIAIGILGATLVFHDSKALQFIYKKPVQITAWIIFISSVLYPVYIPYVYAELFAFVDLVIILNVTAGENSIISLETNFLDYTGKISYGIYMFHWPAVAILVNGFKYFGFWYFSVQYYQLPLLFSSVIVVYILAALSFRYFESYFLKLKPIH